MNKDEAIKLLEEYLGDFKIHPLFSKNSQLFFKKI